MKLGAKTVVGFLLLDNLHHKDTGEIVMAGTVVAPEWFSFWGKPNQAASFTRLIEATLIEPVYEKPATGTEA